MCSEMNSEQPADDSRTDHTHATGVAQSRHGPHDLADGLGVELGKMHNDSLIGLGGEDYGCYYLVPSAP